MRPLDDVAASVGIVTDDEIDRRALRGFRDAFLSVRSKRRIPPKAPPRPRAILI